MIFKKKQESFTTRNRVKIIRGGAEYFQLIEEIADSAQYSLHLQTYIYDEDETGKKIADALIRAARRNVLVYVLLDGYASQHLSEEFIARLKSAGIHFRFFMPLFKSEYFYLGRRLHHKVVVADGRVCMTAGINISNRYNDIGDVYGWLDWAVYMEGEIAQRINDICVKTWNKSVFRKHCLATNNPEYPWPDENCPVRARVNDWAFERTEITNTYRELFRDATSEVIVMTSYFWPPQRLLKRMAAASRRGVKVRLILTATADVPLAKYAERYLYRYLFRHNIEVYEYQKNVLHGKIAIRDNEFITAGSYNVNNISAFASVELNVDIIDKTIANGLHDKFQSIIEEDCVQIDKEEFWPRSSHAERLFFYFSYRIIHLIFFLFTFYFIQRKQQD
ncbi:MAG: phospholipase D/Transphosphatidylase [Flavipsychrobacter sp.]|jgi:cardiolipin synthase|nr:phospholipase D/Transphosphatidylase [Flavipsychrobacter sp.]